MGGEEKVKKEVINRPENALFYVDGREGTLAIFGSVKFYRPI